ncbi:TraR/DksA family transcriptional regulator [Rathayibacter soli]|uniref:TraR/DksA family transcriptional regulator n=1 Tax=Rathayibacter soli TaxID=3144168 RepID=UPI0027E57A02|nr:TraR/DksA C4-type zinc finger protein [Glaciibacter superstes]
MNSSGLSPAQLRRFRAILQASRADAAQHLARLTDSMTEVRLARSDGSADDEHDPEGPTMSQEWSSLDGLVTSAEIDRAAIDAALARIDDNSFGCCTRCGNPIGAARLRARPAAELCIDCARLPR